MLLMTACQVLPALAVKDQTEIVAGVPKYFPPQYDMDAKTGKPQGFAIDIMDEVARRTGLKVKYVVYPTFPITIDAVVKGEVVLVPNIGITDERAGFLDFTSPVETFDIVIFVRETTSNIKSINDLNGKEVAVVQVNKGLYLMEERGGSKLQIYASEEEAFMSLISGKSDAFVYPGPPVILLSQKVGLRDRIKIVGDPLLEVKRSIGVRKGNPELLKALDDEVRNFIKTPRYAEIYAKWYGKPVPYWTARRVAVWGGGLLAFAIVTLSVWRYRSVLGLNRGLQAALIERNKAEDELQVSLEKYRVLFESFPLGISITDKDGRIVETNSQSELLLGLPKEEHVRRTYKSPEWRIIRPDGSTMPVDEFASTRALREQRLIKNVEMGIVRDSGDIIWISVTAAPIPLEGYGVAITYGDISERRKTEEALRESEEIFRNFMEYSPIYVFFKDENIRSIRLSRNYETLLGRPIEELLGKSMDDLFPSDLAKSMIADDMRILREGETVIVEEEFNGRSYWTIKFPINIDGKPRYLAGYTIDITERRKDEETIKKALLEKETLLREIHHRVKNNMQVITSLLRLQAQKIQDKAMRKPFEESEQRIRAMALVHERLYQKEDLSGINFSEYIHDIIKELKVAYRMGERNVSVKINVEDVVLEVDSAIPCGLILNELITNCFKYAFPDERSGEVNVNFVKQDSMYTLTIKDNGVGLPAGFDFRQTKTLGMQIVNVLTKQLMGSCHIRSDGGTEAVITFEEKVHTGGKQENSDS